LEQHSINPQSPAERDAWGNEIKNRPESCDCDHLYCRLEAWMNTPLFVMVVSHRENAYRSIIRKRVGDWCLWVSTREDKGGNWIFGWQW
jgi:hypothetical protein